MKYHRLIVCVVGVVCARSLAADDVRGDVRVDVGSVVEYIESCRKPNGAFGPYDQTYTDAAWSYPAVHALRLLNADIPKRHLVVENGLAYPGGHIGYGHWLVYHQALTRRLLADARPGHGQATLVRLDHQGYQVRYYGSPFGTGGEHFFKADGDSIAKQFRQAKVLGYYNLSSLFYVLAALRADGREIANKADLITFIQHRQASNGGFVDIRTADGRPFDTHTHVAHTFHAVAALTLLKGTVPCVDACARYVQACQVLASSKHHPDVGVGGFRFDPAANRSGNFADAYYTYAALQTLRLVGRAPANADACRKWLLRLQNADGGFGDRPGWRSRLYSTYYAVHGLALLDAFAMPTRDAGTPLVRVMGTNLLQDRPPTIAARKVTRPVPPKPIDPSMNIYQGLFKTPIVTPGDLPGLAKRGFRLLGLKSDDFALVDQFSRDSTPSVVLCPEAYPHRLVREGGPVLHHVGNFTLDPSWSSSQRETWRTADNAGGKGLPWPAYQQQVLRPLQQLGSLCYPEQDFEYEFALSAYDDGVFGRSGYNAVQAGFNWSPRDFVRVFPWRERYTDKLPMVADADSHGDLKKWSPQLDHTRHLYIANDGSYVGFLDAAKNGRVVCVVVGVQGVASGVSYYGPSEAVRFVKDRISAWRWW